MFCGKTNMENRDGIWYDKKMKILYGWICCTHKIEKREKRNELAKL